MLARASRPPYATLTTKLSIVCVALATIIAGELAHGSTSQVAVQPTEDIVASPQDAPAREFSLRSLSSFAEVSQRPLFSETRRPALAADQSTAAWSSFVLQGVIVSSLIREALVLHNKPATLVGLREGDMLDGWTAESILSDRITFRNGNEKQVLTLAVTRGSEKPEDREERKPPQPPARRQAPGL